MFGFMWSTLRVWLMLSVSEVWKLQIEFDCASMTTSQTKSAEEACLEVLAATGDWTQSTSATKPLAALGC
jgi:hypothetical protein